MPFRDDAQRLIDQKKFDELESLWMSQLDRDPSDVDSFITTARVLRKSEQRTQSDTLLGLLSDTLLEKKLWPLRLQVLKELGRLSKHPATLRPQIEQALRGAHGTHKNFQRVYDFAGFTDPTSNPVEKAEKIETWLKYDEGEMYFMAGRGAGIVTELNPDLGIARLDFEKDKRVPVPIGAAAKYLVPLPEGHVLREKFTDAEALQRRGEEIAVGSSSRASCRASAVRCRWAKCATPSSASSPRRSGARGGPRRARIRRSSSAAAARRPRTRGARRPARPTKRSSATSIAPTPKAKLDLARKHSARSKDLADYFSGKLAAEAARLAPRDPAAAWQIAATLETLPGAYTPQLDPKSLITGAAGVARHRRRHATRPLRERALAQVREMHPDWPKVYSEVFFLDEDPRILSLIIDALEEAGNNELRDRLIDETLRYPRRHPRAFYWFVKQLNEQETLSEKANYTLLFQIIDAINSDEFSAVRARLKDMFDHGGLALRIISGVDNEEGARKLVETHRPLRRDRGVSPRDRQGRRADEVPARCASRRRSRSMRRRSRWSRSAPS